MNNDIKIGIPTIFNARFRPIIDFKDDDDDSHCSPITKEDWDKREFYLKQLSKIQELSSRIIIENGIPCSNQ